MQRLRKLTLLLVLMFGSFASTCFAQSESITILSWNVESGGSDPRVIAAQLVAMPVHDIYCLSEVDAKAADFFAKSLGEKFSSKTSATGNADRLQIHFNKERFELLQEKELANYQDYELNNGTHRSPIFVRLKDRKSGLQFIVMTNHLARGNGDLRKKQAIGLREWARDQSDAVINIGDLNLDFDFHTQQGNEAFPEILRDNIYQWVKPVELVDTNWADPDGDGKDNFPDSMLDFAFVAGPAKDWKPVCKVIVRDGDFPDDKTTSDHRAIELTLTPSLFTQNRNTIRDDYFNLVLAAKPVGYWPLRVDANDQSGFGHHGQLFESPVFVQDETGGWVKLDGKSYIQVASDPSFSQPTSTVGLTVEVWMRPHVLRFSERYMHWLGKGEGDTQEWGFRFHSNDSDLPNRLSSYVWSPQGEKGAGAYFQNEVTENEWLHIVACFQPGNADIPEAGVLIYKNGVFQQGPILSPATRYHHPPHWRVFPTAGNAPLRFGTRNDLSNCLDGGLAEIAIYPSVLEGTVIDSHFREGAKFFNK